MKEFLLKVIESANVLIFSKLNFKIVPANRPTRDFSEFIQHLSHLDFLPNTVIDVGVAFGTPSLYKKIPNAKFYLIEPNPTAIPYLDKISSMLSDCKVYHVAAGDENGSIDFYLHTDISGSSALRQVEGPELDGLKVSVPVHTLDYLQLELCRPALLKIDTQGFELKVLEGSKALLSDIDVLIVETSFHEFRIGSPEIHEVIDWMSQAGFRCYDILEGHYRSLDNALAQVDIVFVPYNSKLRQDRSFFNSSQVDAYLKQF